MPRQMGWESGATPDRLERKGPITVSPITGRQLPGPNRSTSIVECPIGGMLFTFLMSRGVRGRWPLQQSYGSRSTSVASPEVGVPGGLVGDRPEYGLPPRPGLTGLYC